MSRRYVNGRWQRVGAVVAGWLLATVPAVVARADRVVLRSGGEVRGVVRPDANRPKSVVVLTESAARPLILEREQVVRVVREPGPLDEYLKRKAKVAETAPAHYDLGVWCESRKMAGPAQIEFEAAVGLDKGFGPAHKKLGHVEQGGEWVTFDEQRRALGLIQYKGRWVTSQEKQRLESQAVAATESASWTRRIKFLRSAIQNGTDVQRREAEVQLAEIRDPAAIGPMMRGLGEDSESFRLLLAQILGAIPGSEATAALVSRVLDEPEPSIRKATLEELIRRKESNPGGSFLKALSSTDPDIVGRAAWALATLKVNAAVPKLLNALVKVEKRMVMVPSPNSASSPPVYSFNSYGAVPSLGTGGSLGLITPPAVGPGVVAYGAMAVPYAPNLNNLSIGGGIGGGGLDKGPTPQMITIVHKNPDVLAALQSLTGADFGYDVDAWKRWTTSSFRPASQVPTRRVPQP